MKQLLLLSVLLLGGSWVVAQSTSTSAQSGSYPSSQTGSQSGSGHASGAGTHSVEGCLSGSGGQYTLTDKHGTAYQLTGDTSQLAEHVGHEIRVTGTQSGGSAPAGGSNDQMGAGGSKSIEISSVKHISKTCKNSGATGGGMSH